MPFQLVEAAGSMGPIVMHTDPGGGVWVAIPMFDQERSRLLYRAPGGVWRTALDGPVLSEASLSSVRPGEVYLGFNRSLDGYLPVLLRVGSDGSTKQFPTPLERIDEHDLLQVGAFAMLSDDDGWACGQRGHLWRYRAGAWIAEAPIFPWRIGDRSNAGYCASLRFERHDLGFAAGLEGEGARWDGRAWTLLPAADRVSAVRPASGLGRREGRLARFEGSGWRFLTGGGGADWAAYDERGRWAFDGLDAFTIGDVDVQQLSGGGLRRAFGVGEIEGLPAIALNDGVYRSTTRDVPTYKPAPDAIDTALRAPTVIDIDGDGDDDLIGLAPDNKLTVLSNRGDGRFFTVRDAFPEGDRPNAAAYDAGDLDGDGRPDLVALQLLEPNGKRELRMWRATGGGRFARSVLLPPAPHTIATVLLVDLDGDGDLDVSGGAANAHLLLNDGAGAFRPGPPMPAVPGGERLVWVDVDGDGDRDAVVSRWRDPAVLVRNDGGNFTPIALPVIAEGAALADLDRDGRVELYAQVVHDRRALRPFVKCVLAETGCASFAETAIPSGRLIDLNLDGRLDVVGTNLRGDAVVDGRAFLGGDGLFEPIDAITGPLASPIALDANGDGALDLLTENRGLLLSTAPKGSMLRVRPRASRSDRLARGAQVIVRAAGSDVVVASLAAEHGTATLGLPDPRARYDVEVHFPAGERRIVHGVAAGSDLIVRDREGLSFPAHLAALWGLNAVRLAAPPRDGPLGLLGLAAVALLGSRPRFRRLRVAAFAVYGVAFVLLFGLVMHAREAWPWLLVPGSLASTALFVGAVAFTSHRRSERHVGPYTLLERLGAGAAATVWRARQGSRTVALKVFAPEAMLHSDARERFFREARAGSEILHDNVVRILDSGHLEDGRCYLAMQLVEGRSLDRVLAEGPRPASRARDIAACVADALAALHSAGIVHRDVKPGNIMVRTDGRAVLTDLGLVRSALFRTVTRHDTAVGTLSYMSPEQCIGSTVDGRSDVWSLGVVLYEMLCGRRPFDAAHELELVYRIHNTRPAPLPADTEADLVAIVTRCLERAPAARFASAAELASALRRVLCHDRGLRGVPGGDR